jgi:hypothetical protein
VRCTPSQSGPIAGTLFVTNNDPDSPATEVSLVCNGPVTTTTTSTTTTSTTTTTTLCPDPDGDGICSAVDNCPADANPGQDDIDEDGTATSATGTREPPDRCRDPPDTTPRNLNGKVKVITSPDPGDGDVLGRAGLTLRVRTAPTTDAGLARRRVTASPTGKVVQERRPRREADGEPGGGADAEASAS